MCFSSTLAMASAQERIDFPCSQDMEGQRIPRSCLTTETTSTPDRSARVIRRQIASSWATAQAPERHVRIARRYLESIRDRVRFLHGECRILPGIRAVPTPGHTPGHIAVEVSSADAVLLYIGDVAVHPLHVCRPEWATVYDILPDEAAASKRRIFDRAADRKALVLGQHFAPFPSLGTVSSNGEGWKWQPIEVKGEAGVP